MESHPLRPIYTRGADAPVAGRPVDTINGSSSQEKNELRYESKRLISLDVFRGLTILGMLLVNNLALDSKTPSTLVHASWNRGVHVADLVFPWFILIIGVAIPYASTSRKRKGRSAWQNTLGILNRAIALVALGCLIDSSIYRQPVFMIDVLQLIGLAYFVGALLYELPVYGRLSIAGIFLFAHWAAIRFVPVPGVGAGAFTHNVNLIMYLDATYLNAYHLNGLISVIPTSALVLIGTAIGDMLIDESITRPYRAGRVLICGLVLTLIGLLWNIDLPFNKPLWTASFIVFCAGLGIIVLGLLYLVIDVKKIRGWSFPLMIFGMNPIVAYVLPILVKLYILRVWKWPMPNGTSLILQEAFIQYCKSIAGAVGGGWLYTFSFIVFWWLVLLQLYRKKVFLRV